MAGAHGDVVATPVIAQESEARGSCVRPQTMIAHPHPHIDCHNRPQANSHAFTCARTVKSRFGRGIHDYTYPPPTQITLTPTHGNNYIHTRTPVHRRRRCHGLVLRGRAQRRGGARAVAGGQARRHLKLGIRARRARAARAEPGRTQTYGVNT